MEFFVIVSWPYVAAFLAIIRFPVTIRYFSSWPYVTSVPGHTTTVPRCMLLTFLAIVMLPKILAIGYQCSWP